MGNAKYLHNLIFINGGDKNAQRENVKRCFSLHILKNGFVGAKVKSTKSPTEYNTQTVKTERTKA